MGILSSFFNFLNGPDRPKTGAFGSPTGYSAGGHGRQVKTWNASPLGPNVLAEINLRTVRERCRDAVRDSALGQSAANHWVSNIIGTGIVPHFLHEDEDTRKTIQAAWDAWTKTADYEGVDSFYGLETLAARELFEVGEVFVRFHVRKDGTFSVQLIESEFLNEFRNLASDDQGNVVKLGIVFDKEDRRIAYDMWRVHPYDTVVATQGMGQVVRIDADEILHVMRRTRANELRPKGGHLTSVLTLLQQIEKYAEAERTRKEMAACFAVFVTKLSLDDQILPPSTEPNEPNFSGKEENRIEPGTAQYLLPGEDVKFPTLPNSGDYSAFMVHETRKVSAAIQIPFESLTGDLTKVNFSSIRAGMLEARRNYEQYQSQILMHMMLEPVMKRWMKESVLNGTLVLPDDYFDDPTPYENCKWVAPGWPWVSPKDEVDSALAACRAGFTSRTQIVRELGFDPEVIDAQQAQERQRASDLGILYDSDPNKILIGKETATADSKGIGDQATKTDADTGTDSEEDDSN